MCEELFTVVKYNPCLKSTQILVANIFQVLGCRGSTNIGNSKITVKRRMPKTYNLENQKQIIEV